MAHTYTCGEQLARASSGRCSSAEAGYIEIAPQLSSLSFPPELPQPCTLSLAEGWLKTTSRDRWFTIGLPKRSVCRLQMLRMLTSPAGADVRLPERPRRTAPHYYSQHQADSP